MCDINIMHIISDVVVAIEVDVSSNSPTSTPSNFNVESFIHSYKLPGVVSINSELSDVFIDHLGLQGNLAIILVQTDSSVTYVNFCMMYT